MMILAKTLTTLTTLTATSLTEVVKSSGNRSQSFDPARVKGSRFLGMSNGGEFVYEVLCFSNCEDVAVKKVFVHYDTATGLMTATV
jgi:hypothetical protein